MDANKVLIGPSSFAELDSTPLNALEKAGFKVIPNPYKRKLTKEELNALLPGVAGLIAGLEMLDREVLEKSSLKVISRCGSGLSNVDLKAARELGIIVKNTPLAPVTSVAELTVGCLILLVRKVAQMDQALHAGNWLKMIGRQLSGMKIAVIGFGNIGREVGRLLAAFGAEVCPVDPLYPNSTDLPTALKEADAVSLHSSGEACILGREEFKIMKDGAYILNAARGGLIDEAALIGALESGKVAGAWLDTFSSEPYSGPLTRFKQAILTPHIGSYTMECRKSMENEAVDNLIKAFKEAGL
ncbi:MAG: phosphoglycerate dehydrogenase [Candidatus Margulisiibacteriota bacterium]